MPLNVAKFSKNNNGSTIDFEAVWTKTLEECGSEEKLLWLAFLPSMTKTQISVLGRTCEQGEDYLIEIEGDTLRLFPS